MPGGSALLFCVSVAEQEFPGMIDRTERLEEWVCLLARPSRMVAAGRSALLGNLISRSVLGLGSGKRDWERIWIGDGVRKLRGAFIRRPGGGRYLWTRFAIGIPDIALVVDHERCRAGTSMAGNAERCQSFRINNASPRKSFYGLVMPDGCGQSRSDLAGTIAVKQVSFSKLFLDAADLVVGGNGSDQE